MQIKYNEEDCSYTLTTNNRIVVRLSNAEMRQIEDFLRQESWRSEIEERIDMEEDCYDFSETSRKNFVDICLAVINASWENNFCFGENTVKDTVYELAQDYGIWRDN